MKSLFEKAAAPDWEAFVKVLRREGRAGRVHNIELFLDAEIQEAVCSRFDLLADLDRSDAFYEQKRAVIIQRFLGYDYVRCGLENFEMQLNNMDAELARLFEDYFQAAFSASLAIKPQFHRIVPIGQSIRSTMEVRPFETAADLVNAAQAWAVQDCICRKQKALIGDPCEHPVDICMVLSSRPGAFDGSPTLRALTHEGALATLRRASDAGLVHSVSNNQKDIYYICNCCTCSCAILRGMAKLGKANVVASSAFVNQVDEALCAGCEECAKYCQFNALTVDGVAHVNAVSCVGCGVCVPACPTEALGLVRRPNEEVKPVPETLGDWAAQRAMARGLARE